MKASRWVRVVILMGSTDFMWKGSMIVFIVKILIRN
jgi:hypothetical protein